MMLRFAAPMFGGALLMSAACSGAEGAPAQGADGSLTSGDEPAQAVDILVVVDNSGSMASEQQKLARETARIVNVLTSGDRYADREDQVPLDLTEKARRFTPASSLHIGVVSTNMGGIPEGEISGTQPALRSCADFGDDGKFQFGTTLATTGAIAGRQEFQDHEQGEVVFPADPQCALPVQPPFQSYDGLSDPAGVGAAFSCVARLGVRGCPFEQPLEAMWKALAPRAPEGSSGEVRDLYTFREGTSGHGELVNSGFLRENAVLVVIHLTDEDDCSVTDAGKGLYLQSADAEAKFGPLNLRCVTRESDDERLMATSRYVRGLRALKPGHEERVIFTAVAGFPTAAIDSGASYDELLAHPDMQFVEDPLNPGFPSLGCSLLSDGKLNRAYPARRLARVAKEFGEQGVLESICAESFGPVLDRVVDKVAAQLGSVE